MIDIEKKFIPNNIFDELSDEQILNYVQAQIWKKTEPHKPFIGEICDHFKNIKNGLQNIHDGLRVRFDLNYPDGTLYKRVDFGFRENAIDNNYKIISQTVK